MKTDEPLVIITFWRGASISEMPRNELERAFAEIAGLYVDAAQKLVDIVIKGVSVGSDDIVIHMPK